MEWATLGLEANTPAEAWAGVEKQLARIGFDQAGLVHDHALFDQSFPASDKVLGHMVSAEWEAFNRESRSNGGFEQLFDVATPSSLGVGVQINAAEALNAPDIQPEVYRGLGELYEMGLVCGWTSPVVNKQKKSFSVLMLATSFAGKEFERLIDNYSLSLDLCTTFLVESLELKERAREFPERGGLTPREQECLLWASLGRSTKQIGDKLSLAESTVNEYLSSATKKLGAKNRQHAVAKAVLLGVIKI